MKETTLSLSRRKFLTAGAGALAVPVLGPTSALAASPQYIQLIPKAGRESEASKFTNIANWTNLSAVAEGAACASCYGIMLWPAHMSTARTVLAQFGLAKTTPTEAKVKLWSYRYPPTGGVEYDYDWPELTAGECTCFLGADVTNKWNAIKDYDPNYQHGLFCQVKGTGVLYMAQLVVYDTKPPS